MGRPRLLAMAAAIVLGAGLPVVAGGPVLVTVTGNVASANRGALDPQLDKLFVFNEVSFERAREFDLGTLETLPQATVRADFPKGRDIVEFTGPLVRDVLASAGAGGDTVTVRAMDGYAVEVPMQEMLDKGAVLALARDGRPLGIGGFGPTQMVFPRADRPELADMPDDWWIWQIYHIDVQ